MLVAGFEVVVLGWRPLCFSIHAVVGVSTVVMFLLLLVSLPFF
jgi:hypothetical protein